MNAQVYVDREESTKPLDIDSTRGYRHQPLDTSTQQIRLIKLRLDEKNRLQLDISVFELSSAPPFVAVSYTWGPPSPQFNISVNGKFLSIRKNLFRFFQAYVKITNEGSPRVPPLECYNWEPRGDAYLWIDQICIDQSSVRERNHQVGMMASIYARSYGTIIWLGTIRSCPDAPLLLGDSKAQDYRYAARTLDLSEAIASVSENEYFTRLWIVQEVVLSTQRKVLCSHPTAGPVWINWDQLLDRAKRYPQTISSKSARYLLLHRNYGNQATLRYAIKTFDQSRCQDPRDNVYGLMGLVEEQQRLQIDYGKSLEELLLDVMTIFYKSFTQVVFHSHDDYHDVVVDLGKTWGIMSTSLEAFLYDTWIKPARDRPYGFGDEGYEYPHIRAMGFLPTALNQSIALQSPYGLLSEPVPSCFKPSEWIPTKDCWWYEVDGITYEIYGLISSLSGEKIWPGCYYKGVKQALQQ